MAHARARIGGVAVAVLIALGLALAPATAWPALAAGSPLRVQAATVYTLDPNAGRVHVAIDFSITDLKPDTTQFIYYYRDLSFGIQPEASSVKVSGSTTSVSTSKQKFFIEATVHLRSNLYYRQTTRFTIRYDLVGGAPRSASPIRVGKAFATFGVWAWGDVGRSTVVVNTPVGYVNTADGDPMEKTSASGGQGLRAEPDDPNTFYAIISSENSAAYGSDRISLPGGVNIVIQAWPEDSAWDKKVGDTLRDAMPDLESLIGLPWPVAHDLDIRERYTPALEGYAGFFLTDQQRIDITEDLDPVVIVHEASHAWLNERLFEERWLYEGMAQEYAWLALKNAGDPAGDPPTAPDLKDPGHVVLVGWTFPQVIRDQTTDDRERYGYAASFWVIDQIVEAAGPQQMLAAFKAASTGQTAYPGAGTPEKITGTTDWHRLIDLTEPIDQPDSTAVDTALRTYAISASDAKALDNRTAARNAYRALLAAGKGWLPGWYIRKQMDTWTFVGATRAMDEATAILTLRDQVDSAASALGLEPDGRLKTAYEGATDNLDAATALATKELATVTAIGDAKTKLDAPRDLATQLGLLGSDPTAAYDTARTDFSAGKLDDATSAAQAATALITGATAAGQQRLVLIAVLVVGALVLVVLAFFLLRRRRQARLVSAGAAATLAPPSAASLPPSTSQPDDAGGPAPGDPAPEP